MLPDTAPPSVMNREDIRRVLPHDGTMLLVDQVLSLGNSTITTTSCFTGEEPFFDGHFPGNPMLPGSILLEIMAQTGAILLLNKPGNEGRIPLNVGCSASFMGMVSPGDTIVVEVTELEPDGKIAQGEAVAYVEGVVVARAIIRCRLMKTRTR